MRQEDALAQQVSDYITMQYPNVIFHFDTGSGGRTSIGMAKRNKKLNPQNGWPDLFIIAPYSRLGGKGLFIELKVKSPYKKDGVTLLKDKHIHEQANRLKELHDMAYCAHFGVGFEDCKNIIDRYLR